MFACLCIGISGCGKQVPAPERTPTEDESRAPATAEDLLAAGKLDQAASRIQARLIESPGDRQTLLVAAKIEAARDNAELAMELLDQGWPRHGAENQSDDQASSPADIQAVGLRYSLRVESGRWDAAAMDLEYLSRVDAKDRRWQDELWRLHNRRGMRHEACQIVDRLCRRGLATPEQSLSLIQRGGSFPFQLPGNQSPGDVFTPGLGMARWYFTQSKFRQAIDELDRHRGVDGRFAPGPQAAAASALYGRLLAETQAYEKLAQWYAQCDLAAPQDGDYWAAIGLYLVDQSDWTAAARALLEAVYRNPTDRVSFQRLSKVFDALGRPDDAAQYRYFGVAISKTESLSRSIAEEPQSVALRSQISARLLELYRPFESLQWKQSTISPSQTRPLMTIQAQRRRLREDPRAANMASEAALVEQDRSRFPIDDALQSTLASAAAPASLAPAVAPAVDPSGAIAARPHLVDVAEEVGLDFQWYHEAEIDLSSIPIYQSLGGAIVVLDYDLDGWPDVYFAQGSGQPPYPDDLPESSRGTRANPLMRNTNGRFVEVTDASGAGDRNYTCGVTAGDVNQDGFPDLWIGNLGDNRLLINNGDGTFSDATDCLGQHAATISTSLAIADLDGDSLPDLFECNYIEIEDAFDPPKKGADGFELQTSPLEHFAQSDRWFRNQGDGTFRAQFVETSVVQPGTSLGVVVTDFRGDGRNEVMVGNDERANHFLAIDDDQKISNLADVRGLAYGFNGAATGCMGIATGDFNRDGTLDLHVTNFLEESANLYLQNPSGEFVDAAARFGIDDLSRPYVGFGSKAIDFDHDGWLDLAITNGHIFDMRRAGKPFRMRPQFLVNRGDRFVQSDVEDASGFWRREFLGRSMSMIDFNRDGATDLIVGHLDGKTALLENRTAQAGHWLELELVGTQSERDAIGAQVTLFQPDSVAKNGPVQRAWRTAGDGYLSRDEAVIRFGLGTNSGVHHAVVKWPSGTTQTFTSLEPGRRHLVVEKQSQSSKRSK